MKSKLPAIKYKVHPKIAQIMQQKQRRRQILLNYQIKNQKQQQKTRKQKKQYFQANKNVIEQKLKNIYQNKLVQRNKVRQQQKDRQIRIAIKRSLRLAQLLPQRNQLINDLRNQYVQYLKQNDLKKQQKIKQMMEKRLQEANQKYSEIIQFQEKIKQKNIIDINEGICILCLTTEAQIYMVQCKHLISCPSCQFMIRIQKKCPVCRKLGNYKSLKQKDKKILKTTKNK